MVSWKERLLYRENELMLLQRRLTIVTPRISPPEATKAWGSGLDQVHALSLIVGREHSAQPERLIKTMQVAFNLKCETVLITPNCFERAVNGAIERARTLQAINAPDSAFREPVVDLQHCATFSKGDRVWIVSTGGPGGVHQASVLEVYVDEDVMYLLEVEPGKQSLAVPQSDVFATDDAARDNARRFNRAMEQAIREGIPLAEAYKRGT